MQQQPRTHRYCAQITWTGDLGTGTSGYRDYSRDHDIVLDGKVRLKGSSDPLFRGDKSRANPEQLLVAALSSCHMLWYLHLCSEAGIAVAGYRDEAQGVMAEDPDGAGQFTSVELRPSVQLVDGARRVEAARLHELAHKKCFIARSVNFEVRVTPQFGD